LAQTMEASEDVESSIAFGYEKATFSRITPTQLEALKDLYQISFDEFQNNTDSSEPFFHLKKKPDAHLAALTIVANAIMNLDEFLTKA